MALNVWTKPSGWNFGYPAGSNTSVNSGSFIPNLQYVIQSVGTTDFTKIGAPVNTVGTVFTATNNGGEAGPIVTNPSTGLQSPSPGTGVASRVAFSERRSLTLNLPIENFTGVTFTKISGEFPPGLRLEGTTIVGSAFEVPRVTDFTFVIRASKEGQISDRTFTITIEGADEPEFDTPAGLLELGDPGELFVMDSTFVDYQIEAYDSDTGAGQRLSYFISRGDGELPPGLTLTQDGRLVGFIQPTLSIKPEDGDGTFDDGTYDVVAYDFAFRPTNGFDSYVYDGVFFDYSLASGRPKKLNRTYQFTVTVTDGDSYKKRTFNIFVVGDDYFRADNTTWLNADPLFTSDVTYMRAPTWLTPSYLGLKRANNYITLILDTYETENIIYELEQVNANSKATTKRRFSIVNSEPVYESANIIGSQFLTTTLTTVKPTVGHFLTFSGKVPEAFRINRVDAVEDLGNGAYKLTLYYPLEVDVPDDVEFLIGTVSELPPGMAFDENNAEVHGLVPYQPAITRTYTFTVTATKLSGKINSAEYVVVPTNQGIRINEIVVNKIDYPLISSVLNEVSSFTIDNVSYDSSNITSVDYSNPSQVTINLLTNIIINSNTKVSFKYILSAGERSSSPKIFTVDILGEVDSALTWNTPSDLGTINANFISTLSVRATSSIPGATILYNLISGRLPPGLTLDLDGEIIGKVNQYSTEDQSGLTGFVDTVYLDLLTGGDAYEDEYSSNNDIDGGDAYGSGDSVSGGNSFTTYATITQPSEFDGGTTSFDRDYVFTIEARDQFGYSAITRTFRINVETPDQLVYSNIRVKPLLKLEQRSLWSSFIDNTDVFTPGSIYRPNDPNFGVQKDLSMVVFAGVETKEAAAYISAIGLNHKRKRFNFNQIKKATAYVPGTQTAIYEVIYVEMADPLEPKGKRLPNKLNRHKAQPNPITIDTSNSIWSRKINDLTADFPEARRPENIITADGTGYKSSDSNYQEYFPNSVSNWRDRIKNWSSDGENFAVERNYLPLWMRSIQPGTKTELDFQLAVPLCYCKVGTADNLLLNIKNYFSTTGFSFNQLDYTVDRYIIDSIEGQTQDKYLVFRNDRITV